MSTRCNREPAGWVVMESRWLQTSIWRKRIGPEVGIEATKRMLNFRCSSVAGDMRLMQSEPTKKDNILRPCMVAEQSSMLTSRQRRWHMNGRNIGSDWPWFHLCSESVRNKQMKGISYSLWSTPKRHTRRSIIVWEAIGRVSEFSATKSFGEKERNSNVVRGTMWRKKVISKLLGWCRWGKGF